MSLTLSFKEMGLINLLSPETRIRAYETYRLCDQAGVNIRLYMTIRLGSLQAAMWRKGRSTERINSQVDLLIQNGHKQPAKLIKSAGPQTSPKIITNALPGESHHQYGRAWDGGPYDAQLCNYKWDVEKYPEEWEIYRAACEMTGMVSGASWDDWPHAELRFKNYSNPIRAFRYEDAWEIMKGLGTDV